MKETAPTTRKSCGRGRGVLQPDRFSLYPPEEWSEGYIFETVREKYILGDDTRTVELYNVQGLAHAAGMLIAYFPKEKIVVQADLYNPAGCRPQRQQPDVLPEPAALEAGCDNHRGYSRKSSSDGAVRSVHEQSEVIRGDWGGGHRTLRPFRS